jgi:flagellar protein FliO/FliZ
MLTMLLGLAVVLALMVGALWLLKQLTQRRGGATSLLKVVAGTAVGPRERVVIVEVGSTWLVLGVAPGRVTPLAEVPRQGTAANVAAAFADNRRPTSADLASSRLPAA